jgi:hypothetical protein
MGTNQPPLSARPARNAERSEEGLMGRKDVYRLESSLRVEENCSGIGFSDFVEKPPEQTE